MALAWKKDGDGFTCTAGPFVLEVRAKGDGRWTWQVTRDGRAPEASGVARSEGAAKSVSAQYVMRSGAV